MEIILHSITTTAIVLAHLNSVQAAPAWGGFSASCAGIHLSNFSLLANYKNQVGRFQAASINLDECIVNDHGTLRCQSHILSGHFGGSCSKPSFILDGDSNDIVTVCPEGSRGINLDRCVGNFNGVLRCVNEKLGLAPREAGDEPRE
ncbi:hypothetical protein C8J56DRAFT_1029238 [Mycena floridula]|nr:hypothetical protein C8J56DRAFT_1029238 [Mycena floridula]